MSRKQNQPVEPSKPGHDPDDLKESERSSRAVGRRGDEYEDIEESRTKSSRRDDDDDTDEIELSDDDIEEEVDLDRAPEGEGPDA